MHLLYVDESGTNKDDRYFVVGGLAVFERQTFFLKERLDDLQTHYFPTWPEPIEFHASHLRAPDAHAKPPFSLLSREERQTLMDEVYRTIALSRARLFAAAIDKQFVPRATIRAWVRGDRQSLRSHVEACVSAGK